MVQSESDRKLLELRDGPNKFLVYMPGEERMRQYVGAQDGVHAKAKFLNYYGVLAVMDQTKQPQADPVDAATVPPLVPGSLPGPSPAPGMATTPAPGKV